MQALEMTSYYETLTEAASPLSLSVAKSFLKLTTTADDGLLFTMISAATAWGEKYTGRDFRVKTHRLYLDGFCSVIKLHRAQVSSITSIKYFVDDVLTTVDSSNYYFVKSAQFSEILLKDGKDYPTDLDNIKQGVQIEFATAAYYAQDLIIQALERHVAHWHVNRGDCSDAKDAARVSGATSIYDQFRIERI